MDTSQISSSDSAAVGSYGPITKDSERVTVGSSSTVKFTERRNATYDIWVFVCGVETSDQIPAEQWPDDYHHHLSK